MLVILSPVDSQFQYLFFLLFAHGSKTRIRFRSHWSTFSSSLLHMHRQPTDCRTTSGRGFRQYVQTNERRGYQVGVVVSTKHFPRSFFLFSLSLDEYFRLLTLNAQELRRSRDSSLYTTVLNLKVAAISMNHWHTPVSSFPPCII